MSSVARSWPLPSGYRCPAMARSAAPWAAARSNAATRSGSPGGSGDGGTVFLEAKGDLVQAGTGTTYRNAYIFKFTFRGGQIAHIPEYANPVTFAKVAGMPIG
jgi:hypothetical protein